MKATLAHNNQSCVQWCDISYEGINKNKVKLTVTYDMGWQNRSSRSRYDSSGGHAFNIGGAIRMLMVWSYIQRPA